MQRLNKLLDSLSEFFAHRKGLLPMAGIFFVLLNGVLEFVPAAAWFSGNDLLLHVGIILAIVGFLLAWAL